MAGVPMLIPKWILKKIGFTGTSSEVQSAISSGKIKEGETVIITDDAGGEIPASAISYNNTTSGLSATSAQGAIDEINNDLKASNETAGLTDVPFKFAVLDDGSYGYLKKVDGADTPVPFKNPQGAVNITANGEVDVENFKTANVNVPLNFEITFTLTSSTSQGNTNSTNITLNCTNGRLSGGTGSVQSNVNIYSYSITSTARVSNVRFS